MQRENNLSSPEERARFALRALYERYDYRPYRMSQFEEYSLYAENRAFLQSPHVITFTDLDGRMMALKPDVTLSIVRHAPDTPRTTEKLYYTENVFRPSLESRAFREISQIGVEAIGPIDRYQTAEIASLAAMSLQEISADFLLEIGHMRFTTALLDALPLSSGDRAKALCALGARSQSGLRAACVSLCEEDAQALCSLLTLYGPAEETLARARALCRSEAMQDALSELACIVSAVGAAGDSGRIQLDLSIAGDTDYYSGVMLRGYVSSLPRAVLVGGRYDNILRRLGKSCGGVGFAIDLSLLARLPDKTQTADVDLLIRYEEGDDVSALLASVKAYTSQGLRVRALPKSAQTDDLRFARAVDFSALPPVSSPSSDRKGGGDAC